MSAYIPHAASTCYRNKLELLKSGPWDGTKPRRWAPLTRDTRKGNKRVKWRFNLFLKTEFCRSNYFNL